ncbi:MAG: radical SAM protein [Candidatus Micrarchaeaceae archaeon]
MQDLKFSKIRGVVAFSISHVLFPYHHILRKLAIPFSITFMNYVVTYRCNSRCIMCNIWKKNPQPDELSLAEIDTLFSNRLLSKLTWIQLSGGEIFLRNDIGDIIKLIANKLPKIKIYIATNGYMFQKIDRVLSTLDSNIRERLTIGVSIDGIGKTHDKIRGINGAFVLVQKTLEILTKYPEVHRNISMTLLSTNYAELEKVRDLAQKTGSSFGFQVENISESYFENINQQNDLRNGIGRIKSYLSQLKMTEFGYKNKFYINGCIKYLNTNKKQVKQVIPCFSGFTSFMLDPYGNVFPCLVFQKKVGNIREQNFDEIYRSYTFKQVRREISKGKCPGCWLACEIGQSEKEDWLLHPKMTLY